MVFRRHILTEKEQRIVDAANELIKAVQDAGYTIHNNYMISGLDIDIYHTHPKDIYITNVLGGWRLEGQNENEVSFKEKEE